LTIIHHQEEWASPLALNLPLDECIVNNTTYNLKQNKDKENKPKTDKKEKKKELLKMPKSQIEAKKGQSEETK